MADRRDLEFTYSLIDRIFRLSLGELADFSGAKYDGDFSLSLEEAQRRKHEYVAEQIGIAPGRRVLDLGCGWGPLLAFIRRRGATGVGVTLSSAQAAACRRHGLDVHLRDARSVTARHSAPSTRWRAWAPSSILLAGGATAPGARRRSTASLFARIASVLPEGGRLYLQTMVFGRNMIPSRRSTSKPRASRTRWYVALMGRQFPGSFLPSDGTRSSQTADEPIPTSFRALAAASTTSRRSASGAGASAAPSVRKTPPQAPACAALAHGVPSSGSHSPRE